jgi:hypothetical protein
METFKKRQKEMRVWSGRRIKKLGGFWENRIAQMRSDTSSHDASKAGGDGSPAVEPTTDV